VFPLLVWCVAIKVVASNTQGEDRDEEIALTLREEIAVASNVLRLRDVCDMRQSNDVAKALQDIPIAPTPRSGIRQAWARDDIAKVLSMRGLNPVSIRWSGSEIVHVSRVESNFVQPASAVESKTSETTQPSNRRDFAPAFTTTVSISQAERVVASAIEAYLQLKTGTHGKWRIKPNIPPQHANAFLQRRQIVSVAGGQEPWEGNQKFALLLRTSEGETVVDIDAEIRLPMMVVAAKGPIARGRVLQESDLVWLALPPASKIAPEDCFSDFESLVGKQLRKAVSTQQPIRAQDVGDPFAVQVGDSVTIAVLAGSVRVEAYGRALESGAVDEMIQVEVLPQKKRVAARVAAERRVEVIAGSGNPLNP
jgi:flagella basal body P-ring formation protein FlgA